MYESMKKPFLRSRKPQKKQKRLEKDIKIGWGEVGNQNCQESKEGHMYYPASSVSDKDFPSYSVEEYFFDSRYV